MMADCERAWDLKWIGLRYFNVAGAGWPDLADPAIMNLIPMVLDRIERGESAKIFGTGLRPPRTGPACATTSTSWTWPRRTSPPSTSWPRAASPTTTPTTWAPAWAPPCAKSSTACAASSAGTSPVEELDRRAGDPPKLIGDPLSIGVDLGWKANNGLDEILTSAWEGWQAGPRPITVPGT